MAAQNTAECRRVCALLGLGLMTELVRMREESFDRFFELAVQSHAEDNVASGRWSTQDALLQARNEATRFLPQGFATKDIDLFEIQTPSSSEIVGYLWAGALDRGTKKVAYLYQLYVLPEYRRQGHARRAIQAYEAMAREGGFRSVALNVFGSNTAAQTLYRSLGFAVTSIGMHKDLVCEDV
jgi:ribosomal protein S18 acetylase RimI-like enzyme